MNHALSRIIGYGLFALVVFGASAVMLAFGR